MPVNPVLICKFADPPEIVRLPPVVGVLVNSIWSNPYTGFVIATPTVENPELDRSCQYFNTPVIWS